MKITTISNDEPRAYLVGNEVYLRMGETEYRLSVVEAQALIDGVDGALHDIDARKESHDDCALCMGGFGV